MSEEFQSDDEGASINIPEEDNDNFGYNQDNAFPSNILGDTSKIVIKVEHVKEHTEVPRGEFNFNVPKEEKVGFKINIPEQTQQESKKEEKEEPKKDRLGAEQEAKKETPEDETADEDKDAAIKIPPNKVLTFKSPGNTDISLLINISNFGKSFDGVILVGNAPFSKLDLLLTKKWYKNKGEIKGIASEINKKLKASKPVHKDGLIAEITEFAIKEIEPLIPTPKIDAYVNFTIQKGCIVKNTFNGEDYKESVLTNFVFDIETQIEDIDTKSVTYEGQIKTIDDSRPISITSEILSDRKLFITAINNTGLKVEFNQKNIPDIIQAFQHFLIEKDIKKVKKSSKIGWHEDEITGSEYFLSKSVIIDFDGIHLNEKIKVEMPENSGPARYIDLDIISDEDFIKCGTHIINELIKLHDPYFMRVSISKTYGSPFLREIAKYTDESKYPTEFIGKPQTGKSLVERLMQSHFGHFPFVDNGFVTFGSSIYSIEDIGQYFNDILYLADDLKQRQLSNEKDMEKISHIIHNYVSGTGRNRIGSMKSSPPIAGTLVITAEGKTTIDEGDASRTLSIIVPECKKNFELRDICLKSRDLYPGFMARYIQWNITHSLNSEELIKKYQKEFFEYFSKISNVDITRFSNMYAIVLLEYTRFCNFMMAHNFMTSEDRDKEIQDFAKQLSKNGIESVSMLAETDPANKLINLLNTSIACGEVIIIDKNEKLPEERPKKVVGRIVDNTICIIPEAAIELVRNKLRNSNACISVDAISLGKIFDERKMLISKDKKGNLKATRIGNQLIGCWAFDKKLFGYETNKQPIKERMKTIPGLIALEVAKLKLPEGTKPSKLQFDNVKVEIYKGLELTENEVNDHADIIDLIVTAYWKGKGWSYDIQSWMKDNASKK